MTKTVTIFYPQLSSHTRILFVDNFISLVCVVPNKNLSEIDTMAS